MDNFDRLIVVPAISGSKIYSNEFLTLDDFGKVIPIKKKGKEMVIGMAMETVEKEEWLKVRLYNPPLRFDSDDFTVFTPSSEIIKDIEWSGEKIYESSKNKDPNLFDTYIQSIKNLEII